MAVSILKPKGSSISSNDKVLRQSSSQKDCNNDTNRVTKNVLPNGITLLYKQIPVNDVVAVNVFIKGGKASQNKAGLANILANMLLKGTCARSARDIAQQLEARGIELDASASDDFIKINLKSTNDDFAEAFMILSDILNNSCFKQEELDKVKETMKNAVKANQDSPLTYSLEKLIMNIYKNHPYGDVGEKIINNLPDISRENIIDYYQKYFVPSNMIISVVGNISPEEVKEYIQQSWCGNSKDQVDEKNKLISDLTKNVLLKETKNTEAAWISMAWIAPKISDKDYATLKVIDAMLGNGLSSRLAVNLREKLGLAYSLGTIFPSRKDKSTFVMYIGTNPKNINIALKGFKKEIKALQSTLITKKELESVKQKLIGQFELSHETNMQQGYYLGWFETMNMGYELDKKFPELINNVTSEQIQTLSKQIFSKSYVLSVVAPEKAVKLLKE